MQQSRQLLGGLEWSEILDSIILMIGFCIFMATVVYVLSKRINLPFISPYLFFRSIYYAFWSLNYGLKLIFELVPEGIRGIVPPVPTTTGIVNITQKVSPVLDSGICLPTFGSVFTHPTCGLAP